MLKLVIHFIEANMEALIPIIGLACIGIILTIVITHGKSSDTDISEDEFNNYR